MTQDYLSYNEGSLLEIYGTYHYYEKRPPCILNPRSTALRRLAPSLLTFSYTGVFPHSAHFQTIVHMVKQMKALNCLQLQLAPCHHSNVLEDRMSETGISLKDCWLEIERSCADVLVLVPNFLPELRSIKIYDCAIGPFREDFLNRLKRDLLNRLQIDPSWVFGWHMCCCDTWNLDV